MITPLVLAEGRAKVNAAKDTNICTYSKRGLPPANWMR